MVLVLWNIYAIICCDIATSGDPWGPSSGFKSWHTAEFGKLSMISTGDRKQIEF